MPKFDEDFSSDLGGVKAAKHGFSIRRHLWAYWTTTTERISRGYMAATQDKQTIEVLHKK